MVPVSHGKCDQAAAVEIDAIEMDKVRILILILAAGAKPNLAVLLVNTSMPRTT